MDTDRSCNVRCPTHCPSRHHATAANVQDRWKTFLPLLSTQDAHQQTIIPDPGSLIPETEVEIARNLRTIQALEQQLCRLKAGMQELQRNLTAYRWQQSRLRTFPSEILNEIFRFSSDEGSLLGDEVDSPPLRLSHVCSRWRSIARCMPSLWAKVNWTTGSSDSLSERQIERRLQMLKIVLDLSVICSLNLNIAVNDTSSSFTQRALSLLCGQSSRWRELDLFCIEIDASKDVLPYFRSKSRYPLLEKLTVWLGPFISARLVFTNENAPKLRSAELQGDCSRLPWEQLESLTLQDWDLGTLSSRKVLNRAKNLTKLAVEGFHLESDTPTRTVCPSIQVLEIHTQLFGRGWGVADFLDLIRVPNLKKLCLRAYTSAPLNAAKIINLITHSGASLQTLSLCNVVIDEARLLSILGLLSSLEELVIMEGERNSSTILTDGLFNALKGTSSSDPLLPKLQHLTIRSMMARPISSTFLDAIIFRLQTELPRLAVTIFQDGLVASDVVRVQQHGLDFQFIQFIQ